MPVKVRCRGCQKVLNAPDKARGKVIACPGCGTKLKIPDGDGGAPASSSAAPESTPRKPVKKKTAARDDDFLSGLNVDQLESEHGEEKVCPYCAADLDPEDPVCRSCGMNTMTGQMDIKEKKKRARRGADPALFYKAAWVDSWAFVKEYWQLGTKTAMVWTTFLTVALTCLFLAKTWVFVEATEQPAQAQVIPGEEAKEPVSPWMSPGFLFYGGVGTVFFLGVPGWYWSLSLKVIDATMQREGIKVDRVNPDIFEAIALGFRVIFWPGILLMPLLPFFSFIAGAVGAVNLSLGQAPSVAAASTLGIMVACYFAIPYLFFPQALVHMTARHRFKAWILWDQLVCFVNNAGATLYWWLVSLVVMSPFLAAIVFIGIDAERSLNWSFEQLDALAAWGLGFMMDVKQPGERPLFYTIMFSVSLPLLLGFISALIGFLAAFPALFTMRMTGLYGVYRRETLGLVTSVSTNQLAGFWVRFLCRAVDVTLLSGFWLVTFGIPWVLVVSEFPLGRYFGGGAIAAVNVGFVAIAGSKNAKASMGSIGLGVLTGVTFIYGASIPVFQLVFTVLYFFLPFYNAAMYYIVNEGSTSRSTIGKEAFGLVVQTVDKHRELTTKQAVTRHFGRVLCDLVGGLPYATAAFTPKKQAPHDMMAKAEVVFRGDNK